MIDYKKTKAPKTTITRDINELTEKVGNIYETVAIIGKRSNQISSALKKELDAKLQDFSIPQDSIEETFENKEQIEISRSSTAVSGSVVGSGAVVGASNIANRSP